MFFRRQMLLFTSSKNTYDHLMSTFFSLFCLINSEKVKKLIQNAEWLQKK